LQFLSQLHFKYVQLLLQLQLTGGCFSVILPFSLQFKLTEGTLLSGKLVRKH